MTALTRHTNRDGMLVVGGGLIVVGLVALAMTYAEVDPVRWLDGSGWTLFIIVPGALLLAAGLLTGRASGAGLTLAGSVVTTVGLLLLGMDQTGRWDAWAYAWALIPTAGGVGLALHGLRASDRPMISAGLRMVAISLILLAVGAWYFEPIFQTGEPPIDLGSAWPIVLIGIGSVVGLFGLLGDRQHDAPTP